MCMNKLFGQIDEKMSEVGTCKIFHQQVRQHAMTAIFFLMPTLFSAETFVVSIHELASASSVSEFLYGLRRKGLLRR